jgi:hypothetical protein
MTGTDVPALIAGAAILTIAVALGVVIVLMSRK